MTVEITKPETEALITERLRSGAYSDAESVILEALGLSRSIAPNLDGEQTAAIERLRVFRQTHGISLGDITIRELRDEARP